MLSNINSNETEEHNKNNVIRFLQEVIGEDIFINTFHDVDLVIHHGARNSAIGVIIEFKKLSSTVQLS